MVSIPLEQGIRYVSQNSKISPTYLMLSSFYGRNHLFVGYLYFGPFLGNIMPQ